jgi:hypothetical protein
MDPTVCINVVRCFYHHGRGADPGLEQTKDWLCAVLFDRGYSDGTRYYHSPDTFLFFFARLLAENPDSDIYCRTSEAFHARLVEQIHADADTLGLAMRVLALHSFGVRHESHLTTLLRRQTHDGGWEIGWLCRYGKTGMKLGNVYLTTALAMNALRVFTSAVGAPHYPQNSPVKIG